MKHSALITHWTLKTSPPFLTHIQPRWLATIQAQVEGMPLTVFHNLDQAGGKANGTVAVIQHIRTHVLQAKIMNGSQKGRSVLVPRLKLILK